MKKIMEQTERMHSDIAQMPIVTAAASRQCLKKKKTI